MDRAFFKLWEILMTYDVVNNNNHFVSCSLCEAPGAFIEAIMFFRDKFSKHSKNDKYFGISLHSKLAPKYVTEYVDYYSQEVPLRLRLFETTEKKDNNGDITNPKIAKKFINQVKECDFITGDGGFNWDDENMQEQEVLRLLLSEIYIALKIQKLGGNFVLKIFETYTMPTIQLLYLLSLCYEKMIITKPFMSRSSNSEKYVICINFISANFIDKLEEIYMNLHENNHHIIDFGITVPDEIIAKFIKMNVYYTNIQLQCIDEIVDFVKYHNNYGTVFNQKRNRQIEYSKLWVEKFFV